MIKETIQNTQYSPNAADCVKHSCPDPMTIFLLMYTPLLRGINIEMSNLYSTQTKAKQLDMGMDKLLTFSGIFLVSGYRTDYSTRHGSANTDFS